MHLCHGQTGTGEDGGWGGGVGRGVGDGGLGGGEIAAHVCLRGAALMKNERMRRLGKVPRQRRPG